MVPMSWADREISLPDGRILQTREAGDSHGRPVFVLHGSPGSRFFWETQIRDATQRGIRLIGYDRPGYGGSTAKPGLCVADGPADVEAIANELGLDRFAVWGYSGGGPFALASAALLPDRVVAAASTASPAPYPAEGIDYFAGMGESNVSDWKLMMSDQAAWEKKAAEDRAGMLDATPRQLTEYLSSLLSDVDRGALTTEVAEFLSRQGKEGLKSGVQGWRDDGLAGAKPWGFELSSIRVPFQLWHGGSDRFVPFAHGEWLAAHLPRAEAHLEQNEGHISLIFNRFPSIHQWLHDQF
jgi:pimeloyl-ACP methyl ester carboxylesterase